MNANICCWCIQRYTCKLTTPILTVCPIFEDDPPVEKPKYEQPYLPWDSLEGCERGGGT